MKLRFIYKYHSGPAYPGLIGNKQQAIRGKKTLQYFDSEKKDWVDVPTVDDKDSYERAKKTARIYP